MISFKLQQQAHLEKRKNKSSLYLYFYHSFLHFTAKQESNAYWQKIDAMICFLPVSKVTAQTVSLYPRSICLSPAKSCPWISWVGPFSCVIWAVFKRIDVILTIKSMVPTYVFLCLTAAAPLTIIIVFN